MANRDQIDERLGWGLIHAAMVGDSDGLNEVVDRLDVDEARHYAAIFAGMIGGLMTRGVNPDRAIAAVREHLHELATESNQ